MLPASSTARAVVNRGVSGNCLLADYASALIAGHDCLGRFDRDGDQLRAQAVPLNLFTSA